MAHSIPFELNRESPIVAARRAPGWSARRKLLCAVLLSLASWMAVLTPLFLLA